MPIGTVAAAYSLQILRCETRKSVFFFSFSENERIGNPCRDGTNKTLDFSLDLR